MAAPDDAARKAPTDQTPYDVFISYARKDNAPIPASFPQGWVNAIRGHILADHRRFSTAKWLDEGAAALQKANGQAAQLHEALSRMF